MTQKGSIKEGKQEKTRKRRRNNPSIVAEEAVAYGFSVPEVADPGERYISPNEAGRILNVTGEAVKQWIYHRRLPANKMANGYWKIKVSDLEAYMRNRQEAGHKRILIVQEPSDESQLLVEELRHIGYDPIITQNGMDALLKAKDLTPSLFLINIASESFNVWQFLEKIRNTRNIKNAPIVMISAKDLEEDQQDHALDLGVQAFIKMPARASTIAEEVQRILQRIL